MADGVQLNPGVGGALIDTETNTGRSNAQMQRVKVVIGAVDADDGDISSTNPMPVTVGGTLPAFAATPTVNVGALPEIPAGSNVIGSIGNATFGAAQVGAWATGRTWALSSGTDSVTATISGTVPISAASLPLPSNAAQETGGNLATIGAAQGASGTGITQPTGGAGILGWLSGIYKALTNTLSVSIGGTLPAFAATPTVNVGTMPALPAGSNTIGGVNVDNVSDAVTANGSVTSATTVVSASTTGFVGGSFQVTSIGTGSTITIERSNDSATWVTMPISSPGAAPSASITSTGIYEFATNAAYVRARVSTYGSGTVTIYLTLKRTGILGYISLANSGSSAIGGLSAGTNLVGDVGVQYRTNATGAASVASILSPATPAAATIKASAGRVVGIALQNSASAIRSVKFFNATSVTMGTTAAAFEIDIPAGGTITLTPDGGIAFATGIMWAVTAAKGLTDNTTTGLAANDVSGVVLYA